MINSILLNRYIKEFKSQNKEIAKKMFDSIVYLKSIFDYVPFSELFITTFCKYFKMMK